MDTTKGLELLIAQFGTVLLCTIMGVATVATGVLGLAVVVRMFTSKWEA